MLFDASFNITSVIPRRRFKNTCTYWVTPVGKTGNSCYVSCFTEKTSLFRHTVYDISFGINMILIAAILYVDLDVLLGEN